MEMSRLPREGTAKPVSRDQILKRERGQGNIHFPCSADHVQDWQPYFTRLIHTLAICDDHTYIHKYILHSTSYSFEYGVHCVNRHAELTVVPEDTIIYNRGGYIQE